jgi:hypothetical protein
MPPDADPPSAIISKAKAVPRIKNYYLTYQTLKINMFYGN